MSHPDHGPHSRPIAPHHQKIHKYTCTQIHTHPSQAPVRHASLTHPVLPTVHLYPSLFFQCFPTCLVCVFLPSFQCNMSTHGQRGECWCVNPFTGVQIPATPKVRGDPNCNQFQEELRVMPTAAALALAQSSMIYDRVDFSSKM